MAWTGLFALQLALEVGIVDRPRHHPRQPECRLEHQHRQQQFPGLGTDLPANDPRVEEVLDLVDDNQVTQRCRRHPDRQRQADNGDQGVGHQVADHRQQAQQEGQHDQRLGQRQVHAEQRHHHREEDAGKGRVEQRDLDLREHDVAKRLHQQVQPFEQRCRQRLAPGNIGDALQGDDRAEDHADQQRHEHVRHALAHQLQVAQVALDPVTDGHLELSGTGGQVALDEGRQLTAGTLHQGHELVQRGAGVFRLVQQKAEGTGNQQRQGNDHQRTEQRYGQPARALAGQ